MRVTSTNMPLSDILKWYNGKAPKTTNDGYYPVFGSNGMIGKSVDFNHEHAIILGRVGAYCGSVVFCTGRFWASDNTIIAKAKEGNDLKYLYYRLLSWPLRYYAGGAAQPLLTHTILNGVKVHVVKEFTKQTHISSILSAYDDLIENNRRRIQLLEQSARLLYKEWFVYLRFPGHKYVKIKDGVPEGWEKQSVAYIIKVNPSETVPKGWPIRYVPMASLSTSGMTVNLSQTEIRDKSTTVRYRNGDVLLARITPCLENGKTGFVNFLEKDEVACGSTEFIVLRGTKVSPYFTYCLARTHDFRGSAIKSMIGSSGRQRVQTSCFDDYMVAVPSDLIRKEFDRVCESIFEQIGCLTLSNQKLIRARDLLLPRLMNGEITV